MLFKEKKIIGLDIGSRNIKLVELNLLKKKYQVVNLSLMPTPNGSYEGGKLVDPISLSKVIQEMIVEVKTKRKHLSMGVCGVGLLIKKISIPKMDKKLIAEQLQWEAEQHIPYEIDEVTINFYVLKNQPENPGSIEVMLVAAVEEVIFKFVEVTDLLKLNCNVLDTNSFAAANCFNFCEVSDSLEPIALFNFGAKITNLSVIQSKEVIYVRDLPIGGDLYTSEIQRALNINFKDAESLKISASVGGAVPEEVLSIIDSTHEFLLEEVESAFQAFSETSEASKGVSETYITGGGSLTLGFENLMAKKYKANRFRPFDFPVFELKHLDPDKIEMMKDVATVCIGLGMRKVSGK